MFFFRKRPRVHLYTICWNEEYILKYFFKHYDELVERYIFYDDNSTDRTLDILKKHPRVEVRPFPDDPINSYVLAAQNVHETCWKESRGVADWVIIVDVDEFLYTPNLKSYLNSCTKQGITTIPALGYQMISSTLPTSNQNLTNLVKRGCPYFFMNKLGIFNPNKILETNQGGGRHIANPIGQVIYPPRDVLLNLHYKYLSFEYTFNRHNDLQNKLRPFDKEQKWGIQYSWTMEKLKQDWDYTEQNAVENVLASSYDSNLRHSSWNDRWWRKNSDTKA